MLRQLVTCDASCQHPDVYARRFLDFLEAVTSPHDADRAEWLRQSNRKARGFGKLLKVT